MDLLIHKAFLLELDLFHSRELGRDRGYTDHQLYLAVHLLPSGKLGILLHRD